MYKGPVSFTELKKNMEKLDTTDTSSDKSTDGPGRCNVLGKKTYKMKSYDAYELRRFSVTEPTDAAGKRNHVSHRICRKDMSVLKHGPYQIQLHFQDERHFSRDHRLWLETPGWRFLDFDGNLLPDEELD